MTIYWARIRNRRTGVESVAEYDSQMAREFALLILAAYVDVLERGVATRVEAIQ